MGYGGISSDFKQIAFVNLREIRDIKFGTKGAQVYHDLFYGTDLEIFAYGSFTVKIIDPARFITNFVPANTMYYSFDDDAVRAQILSEFLMSFTVALNSLSDRFRISQLPAQANQIAQAVINDTNNAGTWPDRFGISIVQVAVENIEFSEESRALVQQYSANKMNVMAYEDVSDRASNIAAQQKIAQGVQNNGLGDGGSMIMGMNIAQGLTPQVQPQATPQPSSQSSSLSLDEQISALEKLKGLLDVGILSQEEFDLKKKEIMGL